MTEEEWEAEWQTSTDVENLLRVTLLPERPHEMRLFACACCRLVLHLLPVSRGPELLELLELGMDCGAVSAAMAEEFDRFTANLPEPVIDELVEIYAYRAVSLTCRGRNDSLTEWCIAWQCVSVALEGEAITSENPPDRVPDLLRDWERRFRGDAIGCTSRNVFQPIADLLRCIVGNPFWPVAFDPRWQTEHTVGLAAKMYDERNFDAMPILADALEEVGGDNGAVLGHCREPGLHARGCWVVDAILGKR